MAENFIRLRALQGLTPTDSLIMFLNSCWGCGTLLNFGERKKEENDLLKGILYFQLFQYAFSTLHTFYIAVGHCILEVRQFCSSSHLGFWHAYFTISHKKLPPGTQFCMISGRREIRRNSLSIDHRGKKK